MGDFETGRMATLVRQKVSLPHCFNNVQWMLRNDIKVHIS